MAMEPIPRAPANTLTVILTPDLNTETPLPTPHNHLIHQHPPTQTLEVSYRECLKNHAASSGGHALDGCCEFMPGATCSLTCAACGCHRNFHRRDPDDPTPLDARVVHSDESVDPRNGKRFRTKFSEEQKDKMQEFAEKIGWRLRRSGEDRSLVDEFCKKVGIRKGVFKVWMHNNKINRNQKLNLHHQGQGISNNNIGNCSTTAPLLVYHHFYAQQAQ